MTRRFITVLLCASLSFSTLAAAPARADEDVAKVIAGLAALFILKEAIDNRNDRRVTRENPGRIAAPIRKRKVAPSRCLREQWTHRGVRNVYGARCMQRRAEHALPRKCLREANTNSGPRRFYTRRCLRKSGWRA